MMWKRNRFYLCWVMGVCFILFWSGCCLIGAGIGAFASGRDSLIVPPGSEAVSKVIPGKTVQIALRNGYTTTGKVEKLQKISPSQYRAVYEDFLNTHFSTVHLPAPGDTLALSYRVGRKEQSIFQGWDMNGIWIRAPESGRELLFPYKALNGIKWSSTDSLSMDSLRSILAHQAVPRSSRLIIRGSSGKTWELPWEEIKLLMIINNRNYVLPGFLIGAAIDAYLIYQTLTLDVMPDSIYLDLNLDQR